MENWFKRIFLKRKQYATNTLLSFTTAALISFAPGTFAQDDDDQAEEDQSILDAVINPDIERRKIKEDRIDSENFEFGFFAGVMSVEDFGSNDVYGARFSYHVTEDFFLEAGYGATKTSKTSYEDLSGGSQLLDDDQRDLNYLNFSLGINLLPGEVYIGKHAFNTNYYVIGGIGDTEFAGNNYFTYNFGAGFRLFFTDWLAARVDFRNHLFTHSLLGEDKSIQNLEAHMGLSIYF